MKKLSTILVLSIGCTTATTSTSTTEGEAVTTLTAPDAGSGIAQPIPTPTIDAGSGSSGSGSGSGSADPIDDDSDVTFSQGPVTVSEEPSTACETDSAFAGSGSGSGCGGQMATVLTRDVYVAKSGTDSHVSSGSKHFDLDASEGTCSKNPYGCLSSEKHGYARTFAVKVTCDQDKTGAPVVKFDTTLGTDNKWPKNENAHTEGLGLNGYACAKAPGVIGTVSAACKTKGLSEIAPQQIVQGAAAGTISQDLYVAFASQHCARQLFSSMPDGSNCSAPELSAEAAGIGFKFTAKNENFSGKKKVTCTATCGANPPTLDCKEVEDGNL